VKRASCCILLLACAAPALAQYPSKPVRIVVPYSAGGGTDIVARAVGQKLSDKWHQSVIVDNRVGANGIIGADAVAKAPADGYTLLMATPAEGFRPIPTSTPTSRTTPSAISRRSP